MEPTARPLAPSISPPGWHPDPWREAPLRWWDGVAWSGYTSVGAARPLGADPSLRWLLPVGRSGWAIAAGYLGLVSVLFVFAPFALLAGIKGLHDIATHPERLGRGRAWFGVVMGGVFTAVLVVVMVASASR